MKVTDVMTTQVTAVKPSTSFKEAVDLLVEYDVGALPVVDDSGLLIGIVTEADMMSKEAFGEKLHPIQALLGYLTGAHYWSMKAPALTVEDLMTRALVTAEGTEDVRVAARRMLVSGVKRLPVVDDRGHLVGIVSRHDVLRVYHRDDAEIQADLDARLASPLYAPEDHRVKAHVSEGVVTLTGVVEWELEVPVVQNLAETVPGVVTVINLVTYRERGPR